MGRYSQTPIAERFALQHQKGTECWEWAGHISAVGYGQIKDKFRTRHAHRVSWELHRGEIPSGMCVCHSCNNKKCVNPSHLYLASFGKNSSDAARDGLYVRGERHHKARLTEGLVEYIRSSTEDAREIAKRIGVSFSTVYRARNGTFWNRRQG